MSQPSSISRRTALAVAVLALLALAPREAAAADELTLRVNDARGGPGDLVAVVVRTYASRPIGQGQICIGTRRGGGGRGRSTAAATTGLVGEAAESTPFARLEKVEVFSAKQDATFQFSFDGQEADVTFRSPTGSINAVDGPLAVFHFRLSNSVKDGEVYEISLDVADSLIVDGSGQRLAIESKPGELKIREDDDGEEGELKLAATGGRVRRGKVARVKLGTEDRVALSSGRIGLRYDPKLAKGKPWVRIDPRYGKATVLVNTDTPGLVIIDFQSPDRSLNRVPGDLFEVRMVISRQAPRGRSPVTIDRGLTSLRDEDGDPLDLEVQNGVLIVR